jgi:hypothetical protein
VSSGSRSVLLLLCRFSAAPLSAARSLRLIRRLRCNTLICGGLHAGLMHPLGAGDTPAKTTRQRGERTPDTAREPSENLYAQTACASICDVFNMRPVVVRRQTFGPEGCPAEDTGRRGVEIRATSRKKKNTQSSRSSLSASNDCRLVEIPPPVFSAGRPRGRLIYFRRRVPLTSGITPRRRAGPPARGC